MKNNTKSVDSRLKIEWFGIDGFLVLLYPSVCATIFYGVLTKNDFLIGKMAPYTLITACTLIFMRYLFQVVKFMKTNTQNADSK